MAERSFPLEGTVYTAEEAALWFATRTNGVYASNDLAVGAGSDMTVYVGKGMAWLRYSPYAGVAYANTETKTLSLAAANANYPRIDRVVVRYSESENRVYLAVLTGTPATSPIPPIIRNMYTGEKASVAEISLAQIYVPANAITITEANITDERLDPFVCGLMRDGVTGIDTSVMQAQFTAFMNEQEVGFETWFENLQATLDGDVAANLAAEIATLKNQMPTEENPLPVLSGGTGVKSLAELRTALELNLVDFTDSVTYNTSKNKAKFAKQGNIVTLNYISNSAEISKDTVLFTLPADYCPAVQYTVAPFVVEGTAYGRLMIDNTTGEAKVRAISSTATGVVTVNMSYIV